MNQFHGLTDFTFNGYSSKLYSLKMVEVGDSDTSIKFGITREAETTEGVNYDSFIQYKNKTNSFPITIMKMTEGLIPLSFNKNDYDILAKWLYGNNNSYNILNVGDKVYYGHFSDVGELKEYKNCGYITLTFQMASPYVYSNIVNAEYYIDKQKIITLENKSITDILDMDIEVELLDNTSNIVITNITTQENVSLQGITKAEDKHFYIKSDDMTITNMNKNYKDNIMIGYLQNDEFLKLRYGVNKLKIVVNGKARVKFIFQNELALT